MSRGEHERAKPFEAQHAAIIAKTLAWADEAAARDDYVEAVRWVETVRAPGNELPGEYKAKHVKWRSAMETEQRSGGS